MAKNYYLILGVTPDATSEEIKSAYRRRAKEYHPDRFVEGNQPFLDVQEAFTVLGNPVHRRAYDRSLRDTRVYGVTSEAPEPETLGFRKSKAEPLRKPQNELDLGDASLVRSYRTYTPSFDEIFDRLWRNFGSLAHPKGEMLKNLNVEFRLTPDQARKGGHVRIMVPAKALCPTCRGRGGVGLYECWRCAGEGNITGEFPVTVAFPSGTYDGYQLEFPLDQFGIRNIYMTVIFRLSHDVEI
jgi:DnaJ-class molecular chaperone